MDKTFAKNRQERDASVIDSLGGFTSLEKGGNNTILPVLRDVRRGNGSVP